MLFCDFSFAFARIFTFLIAFLPPRGHTFFVCFQIVDVFLLVIASRGSVLQFLRADILDIVAWAMGGQMLQFGDADRPPIRISHHSQAYLHAAGEAAVAAVLALHHRRVAGEGQHIDVSVQEAIVPVSDRATGIWDMMKFNIQRGVWVLWCRLR